MKSKIKVNYNNADFFEEHLKLVMDHGINLHERIISIVGEIDEEKIKQVSKGLSILHSINEEPITIQISSEGGSAYDATTIVALIRKSPCKIITEGFGLIASAATLILACGDERRISEYAYFMYHESSYEASGGHRANKNRVLQNEREENAWAKWMSDFSKKDKRYWLDIAEKGLDVYLSAEELLATGAVDDIIENLHTGKSTKVKKKIIRKPKPQANRKP